MADEHNKTPDNKAEKEKRSRHRSPNYPLIGLEKALERAKTVKDKALRHFISAKSAHEAWDYKSGVGDQVIAALKAFGLVETQGVAEKRQIRLTEAAWRILGNAPDRVEKIEEAALAPEIHQEIWDKFEGPPPSDTVLRDYLLWEREHKFNESTVDGFIAQYRSTIAFAGLDLSDKLLSEEVAPKPKDKVDPNMHHEPPAKPSPPPPQQNPFVQFRHLDGAPVEFEKPDRPIAAEWSLNLSRDSEARVVIYGKPSQQAIDKLANFLDLQKDTFPTKEELEAPRQAIWKNKDHDQPVTVTGELGAHDGRRFFSVKETTTGIPEDELEFKES